MRITTQSIMMGYNRELTGALNRWNKAQNRVLTQRNFNTIAEDPAAANRAFQLRKQFRQNASNLEITQQTQALVDQVTSSAMQISNIMANEINPDILEALNGTNSDESSRKTYAETLRGMQKSIVLSANTQVGGRFLFSGEDTHNVPFVLSEDGKTLTYRGKDVNVPEQVLADPNDPNSAMVSNPDYEALQKLSEETLYVDLGFGLKEDAQNNLIGTSAFNTATPGINLLGYGVDEDGNSNNVVVLLGQMADALENPNFDDTSFSKMVKKFRGCLDTVTDFESNLGTKQQFLKGTVSRLEDHNDTLNTRIVSLEKVDMAEAISSYTWQGYAYNAALKVGTDIVSQSLLDFMR